VVVKKFQMVLSIFRSAAKRRHLLDKCLPVQDSVKAKNLSGKEVLKEKKRSFKLKF
jgi:hypothetical protein